MVDFSSYFLFLCNQYILCASFQSLKHSQKLIKNVFWSEKKRLNIKENWKRPTSRIFRILGIQNAKILKWRRPREMIRDQHFVGFFNSNTESEKTTEWWHKTFAEVIFNPEFHILIQIRVEYRYFLTSQISKVLPEWILCQKAYFGDPTSKFRGKPREEDIGFRIQERY